MESGEVAGAVGEAEAAATRVPARAHDVALLKARVQPLADGLKVPSSFPSGRLLTTKLVGPPRVRRALGESGGKDESQAYFRELV